MEFFPRDDGIKLALRNWDCPNPKGVLHIVHGMSEHSLRYGRLAELLNQAGIAVRAADMRGHGATALEKGNSPSGGGRLGHCADSGAIELINRDIDALNRAILRDYPGVPLFLMGHSWGSFLVQNYIETLGGMYPGIDNAVKLSGCILSGTRGPLEFGEGAAVPIMKAISFFIPKRGTSSLSFALVDGPLNKPFKPNRTPFDWLSRDEKEVDAYIADPLCGKRCSAIFYRDLAVLLSRIYKRENMAKIRDDLPIYIFSGSADPVGAMGEGPAALAAAYRVLKIREVELVLYPGARHETLNETNRDEVAESLRDWIEKRCGKETP